MHNNGTLKNEYFLVKQFPEMLKSSVFFYMKANEDVTSLQSNCSIKMCCLLSFKNQNKMLFVWQDQRFLISHFHTQVISWDFQTVSKWWLAQAFQIFCWDENILFIKWRSLLSRISLEHETWKLYAHIYLQIALECHH